MQEHKEYHNRKGILTVMFACSVCGFRFELPQDTFDANYGDVICSYECANVRASYRGKLKNESSKRNKRF